MRVAGLATRQQLEQWYHEGKINGDELLTLMLAGGASEDDARDLLGAAHERLAPPGQPTPDDTIEPDLPEYYGPTRRIARRPPKRASELRGHPLDG
jgi:hypothetical protein